MKIISVLCWLLAPVVLWAQEGGAMVSIELIGGYPPDTVEEQLTSLVEFALVGGVVMAGWRRCFPKPEECMKLVPAEK